MSDPRLIPDPARVSQHEPAQISVPVCNLLRAPAGARDRQLLFGTPVTVLHKTDQWAYVQSGFDGYVGHVQSDTLCAQQPATHIVTSPSTHAYRAADLKSPDQLALSHLSRISALSESETYIEMSHGFVPKIHLSAVGTHALDPAEIAATYLGTDYLWGGNSRWGIDCSGLVQAALAACGITCPGDSDQQQSLGVPATAPFQRNDLLFWKGHVAIVSDPNTLIHANAHAMAVSYEPIKTAIARIKTAGDGPVTAHRRL